MSVVLGHNDDDCRWALARNKLHVSYFKLKQKRARKKYFNFKDNIVVLIPNRFFYIFFLVCFVLVVCFCWFCVWFFILWHIQLLMIKKCWYYERLLFFSCKSIDLFFYGKFLWYITIKTTYKSLDTYQIFLCILAF